MEDKRIKECWVVLQDCAHILPISAANSKPVTNYHNKGLPSQGSHSSNSLFSNAYDSESDSFISQETSSHSKLSPVKRVSRGEKCSIKGQSVKRLKKAGRLHKVKHKKRRMPVNKQTSPASNHAKRHLFQKYGEGLLRKPSFSVDTNVGKHELSYAGTLKEKLSNSTSSRTADSALGYSLQSPSLININNNRKDTVFGINRTQVKRQSALKTFFQVADRDDQKKTETRPTPTPRPDQDQTNAKPKPNQKKTRHR